jgi:hypothetical protein
VYGAVDAENSFGAMIRTDYECTVEREGDTWDLVRISLDD